jgi:hypothetical protein
MKNIFVIFCSIFLHVLSFNEITPKLCVNCKFFINDFTDNKYGKCSLFPKTEMDIDYFVTGIKKKSTFQFCSIARNYDDMCGKKAKKYIYKFHNNRPFKS